MRCEYRHRLGHGCLQTAHCLGKSGFVPCKHIAAICIQQADMHMQTITGLSGKGFRQECRIKPGAPRHVGNRPPEQTGIISGPQDIAGMLKIDLELPGAILAQRR